MDTPYVGFESLDDIRDMFGVDADADLFPTEDELILAKYETEYYDEWAWVVFVRDGTLYEVHGSACSCDSLYGQWEPEETSLAAIEMRHHTPPLHDIVRIVREFLRKHPSRETTRAPSSRRP